MTTGAGSSPAGGSPAGVALFDYAAQPNGAIYLDANGAAQGSALIDPITKQHARTPDGFVIGQPNAQQLVYMALLTVRGSSALGANFGLAPAGGVIDDGFAARRTSQIRDALSDLVDNKRIEIVAITVDTTTRPVFTIIQWRDLMTNTVQPFTL